MLKKTMLNDDHAVSYNNKTQKWIWGFCIGGQIYSCPMGEECDTALEAMAVCERIAKEKAWQSLRLLV